MVAALGLLTACDPSKDSIGMPGNSDLTGEQLASGFTTKQFADETFSTEAADGNYFQYFTSPSRAVTIYQLDEEGARNVLASGKPSGTFKIVPKRGNPSQQTYYVETRDFNGNIITGTKSANVFVPSELAPEMRLLASDSYGSKIWKWDFIDGPCWGNGQYAGNDGADFANNRGNQWWGVSTPEELTGQLGHSDTGVATGEESADAYMTFDYATGKVTSYSGAGSQIRQGNFEISYNMGERLKNADTGNPWELGTLKTDAGSILFPFKINGGGTKPTDFDILKLTNNQLVLVYGGNGAWGEATYWRFKKK